jgi:hypothetical protein
MISLMLRVAQARSHCPVRALAMRSHRVLLFAGVGPVSPDLQGVPGLEVVCLGQH